MKEWKIAIGESDFKSLIEDTECYYVDKTMFIKDVIENKSRVALITRPRRFGKTLNMSMLKYFFSIDEESRELFKDLKIMKAGEKYTSQLNSKPVIYLTMNGMYDTSFENMINRFKLIIKRTYGEHRYLLESEKLFEEDKKYIKDILFCEENISVLQESILNLALMLNKHYGKKSIVLVDEYDVPIQNAYTEGYYEEAINFFKSFYGATFKDNQNIEKTVITGVSRVSKEGIFSRSK